MRSAAVVILAILAVFGCGDDDDGPGNGYYGDGYYGVSACRADYDCAPGTSCVDERQGTCWPLCRDDYDCPPDLRCKDVPRRGAGGKARVCVPR
jgi:hypothetical protein